MYAGAGTPVKLSVSGNSGTITIAKNLEHDTCGAGYGGKGIVVDIKVNGVTVGSVSYEHLDNISAGPYTNGMILGYISSEPFKVDCYTVAHAHVEMKNASDHACYVDKGAPNVTVNEGSDLGVLGTSKSSIRQPCSSSDIPAASTTNGARLLGDVNGDYKDDAVVFFGTGSNLAGNWYVAQSTGSSFGGVGTWLPGTGAGSDEQFLADMNGDNKDDAVMYWKSTGNYYVALSDGTGFGATGSGWWSLGQINGTEALPPADINGGGKADFVTYAGSGNWYRALSSGSAMMDPFSLAGTGHGSGSSKRLLKDITGDGKADAVAYFGAPYGNWWVAPSVGSSWGGANSWATGFGSGSSNQMMGDIIGNGKAHIVAYFGGSNGWWYVGTSNGSGITSTGLYSNGFGVGSDEQFVGDVNGDGRADAIVYHSNIGRWYVQLSNGYNTPFGGAVQWINGHGIGS